MKSDPKYKPLVGPKGGTSRIQRRLRANLKPDEADTSKDKAAEEARLEGANILASINSPNPPDKELNAAKILASRLV